MGEALSTWPGLALPAFGTGSPARHVALTSRKPNRQVQMVGQRQGKGQGTELGGAGGPLPASALTLQDTLGTIGTTS